jgi:hypothetical protein
MFEENVIKAEGDAVSWYMFPITVFSTKIMHQLKFYQRTSFISMFITKSEDGIQRHKYPHHIATSHTY